jgi:hypothetical protein
MLVPAQSETADVDRRTRELLEAPLIRLMLRLAAPNALVMMTTTCIGLIELYFVAKLGVDSLMRSARGSARKPTTSCGTPSRSPSRLVS